MLGIGRVSKMDNDYRVEPVLEANYSRPYDQKLDRVPAGNYQNEMSGRIGYGRNDVVRETYSRNDEPQQLSGGNARLVSYDKNGNLKVNVFDKGSLDLAA